MPSYYEEKTKTWFCKFYYQDYTGTRRQKKKRGFKLQREAKEWERNFLERQQGQPDMTMESLIEIYMEDTRQRMKASTIYAKENRIEVHILPYFGKHPINAITPAHIRKWQTELMKRTTQTGQPLSPTYLNVLHHTLSSLFNYAVRYHGLKINPCIIAGSIGKSKSGVMGFWTLDEYRQFISSVDHPLYRPIFEVLYYTGVRVGELLALTFRNIDLENGIIHISKTLKRIGYENIISTPKTAKSKRDILIPCFLVEELKEYYKHVYDPGLDDLVFPTLRANILYNLKQYAKRAGVKEIRVHDLRHSHVALLVELGFNPLLIAERLGHEDIKTTLNTYSHLYPNKQIELINKLDSLVPN
ncbi:site-specific recombinase XerD [Clostridium sp. ASBs410]|nr:site-specific recombinase XerD [Clostridium sp. ASBs410]